MRSRRAASWPRGAPGFAWSYFAPQRVPRLSQSQESATTTILDLYEGEKPISAINFKI